MTFDPSHTGHIKAVIALVLDQGWDLKWRVNAIVDRSWGIPLILDPSLDRGQVQSQIVWRQTVFFANLLVTNRVCCNMSGTYRYLHLGVYMNDIYVTHIHTTQSMLDNGNAHSKNPVLSLYLFVSVRLSFRLCVCVCVCVCVRARATGHTFWPRKLFFGLGPVRPSLAGHHWRNSLV